MHSGHTRPRASSRNNPQSQEEVTFEYGSKEADQAAKKLQELGAMVYPPGNKAAIDWGMLAGTVICNVNGNGEVGNKLELMLMCTLLHIGVVSMSLTSHQLAAAQ